MKLTLTLALLLFASVAVGQTSRAQIGSVKIYDSNDPWSIPDSTIGKEYFTIAFLQLYSLYEAESDTLRAKLFEGEYIVQHETYGEMLSERQLLQQGYRYAYRWVKNNTLPFEIEYVFVREPTLRGFRDFLKRQK